jgi:hypothetical protein
MSLKISENFGTTDKIRYEKITDAIKNNIPG